MAFLIGTDEAGYGPNLGPLVVSASVWEVDDGLCDVDLYEILHAIVDKQPAGSDTSRLTIADSKVVYKPGGGLAGLEETVLPAMDVVGQGASSWREIWSTLAGVETRALQAIPWYAEFDSPLPIDADSKTLVNRGSKLSSEFANRGVRLVALRSKALFPEQFNAEVDETGSKGELLSMTTLRLVRELMDDLGAIEQQTKVICDKHGGRDKYVAMLQEVFHEWWVTVRSESRHESVYRLGMGSPTVEFRFRRKG